MRLIFKVAPSLGIKVDQSGVQSVTRGLIGDTSFACLPNITPKTTFALTLVAQAVRKSTIFILVTLADDNQPGLLKVFVQPSWDNFVGALTLCGYASFLFGWHVHEKAILLVIVPFSLIALKDRRHLGAFRPLIVAGHVSLFPLLYTAAEFPLKIAYTVFWLILFLLVFDRLAPVPLRPRIFLLDRFSFLYTALSIPLIIYCSLLHQPMFGQKYEFVPLMFISSYSAIGVVGSWLGFLVVYFYA